MLNSILPIKSDDSSKLAIGADYRPNLLINGDFQVWSRGISFNPSNQAYCVDKWYQLTYSANEVSIIKVATGLEFNPLAPGSGHSLYLVQDVSNGDKYIGKSMSISTKVNGAILTATGIVPSTSGTFASVSFGSDASLYLEYDSASKSIKVSFTTITTKLTIEWVKLELNDHSTQFIPLGYDEECIKIGLAVTKTVSDMTYYVSPSGSDSTGTGGSLNPFKTIQRIIDLLPKNLGHAIKIILIGGTYNEKLSITGFVGSGSIEITGSPTLANAGLFIIDSGIILDSSYCRINISGINVTPSTTLESALSINNCPSVYIKYAKLDGAIRNALAGNVGMVAKYSTVHVQECDFSNFVSSSYGYAIHGLDLSKITVSACTGTNNQYSHLAQKGAVVSRNGSQPAGTYMGSDSGGQIAVPFTIGYIAPSDINGVWIQ